MSEIYKRAKLITEKRRGELAVCKYCGMKPTIIIDRDVFRTEENKKGYTYSVCCITKNCDFTSDKILNKAIKKWNDKHGERKDNDEQEEQQ